MIILIYNTMYKVITIKESLRKPQFRIFICAVTHTTTWNPPTSKRTGPSHIDIITWHRKPHRTFPQLVVQRKFVIIVSLFPISLVCVLFIEHASIITYYIYFYIWIACLQLITVAVVNPQIRHSILHCTFHSIKGTFEVTLLVYVHIYIVCTKLGATNSRVCVLRNFYCPTFHWLLRRGDGKRV